MVFCHPLRYFFFFVVWRFWIPPFSLFFYRKAAREKNTTENSFFFFCVWTRLCRKKCLVFHSNYISIKQQKKKKTEMCDHSEKHPSCEEVGSALSDKRLIAWLKLTDILKFKFFPFVFVSKCHINKSIICDVLPNNVWCFTKCFIYAHINHFSIHFTCNLYAVHASQYIFFDSIHF